MHPAVLSLLASAFISVAAVPLAADPPKGETILFKEIGKTTYARVFVDPTSVKFDHDRDGSPIASMLLKINLNKPTKAGVHSIVNAVVFACSAESALVVTSASLGKDGEIQNEDKREQVVPWVRGSDSVTNVIMEKLCEGVAKKQQRGVLTT